MTDIERVKNYYNLIVNEVLPDENISERQLIVRWLEQETGQDFKNTQDFYDKMDRFIANNGETPGDRLKKAREKKGWSQQKLSLILSVSKQFLSQMEGSRKPLNKKALRFLENSEC